MYSSGQPGKALGILLSCLIILSLAVAPALAQRLSRNNQPVPAAPVQEQPAKVDPAPPAPVAQPQTGGSHPHPAPQRPGVQQPTQIEPSQPVEPAQPQPDTSSTRARPAPQRPGGQSIQPAPAPTPEPTPAPDTSRARPAPQRPGGGQSVQPAPVPTPTPEPAPAPGRTRQAPARPGGGQTAPSSQAASAPASSFSLPGTPGEPQYHTFANGFYHVLAVTQDGKLWAWGWNQEGQVGDGTTQKRSQPVQVMDNVRAVGAGGSSSFAITNDGALWTWGENDKDQLARSGDELRPGKAWANAVFVTADNMSVFAIDSGGTLHGWGYNNGILGTGNYDFPSRPARVANNIKFAAFGGNFSLSIDADNTLWGASMSTSAPIAPDSSLRPIKVADNVVSAAGGDSHALYVDTQGVLWGFGSDMYGQVGANAGFGSAAELARGVRKVAAGREFTAALYLDGRVETWGRNNSGQLGHNNDGRGVIMENVVDIFAADDTLLMLKDDGALWLCGDAGMGFGDSGGPALMYRTPTKVLDNVKMPVY